MEPSGRLNALAFAPTQTIVWAYANGCLSIRERSFGRTQTVKRGVLLPIQHASYNHSERFLPSFRTLLEIKKNALGSSKSILNNNTNRETRAFQPVSLIYFFSASSAFGAGAVLTCGRACSRSVESMQALLYSRLTAAFLGAAFLGAGFAAGACASSFSSLAFRRVISLSFISISSPWLRMVVSSELSSSFSISNG